MSELLLMILHHSENIDRSIINIHNLHNQHRSPEAHDIEDTKKAGAGNIADSYELYTRRASDKVYARDLLDDYHDHTTLLRRTSPRMASGNGALDNPGDILRTTSGGDTANSPRNNGMPTEVNTPSNSPGTGARNAPPQPHQNMNELQALGLGRRVRGGTSLQGKSSRWSL